MLRKLISAITILFISLTVMAQDVPDKPLRDYPVNQFFEIFTKSEQKAIDQMVLLNYDSTGVQIVVVVVETTNGMPVNEYADWIGEKWGVGQKELDNGIVFLIAVNTSTALSYASLSLCSSICTRISPEVCNSAF